jgi:polysaccharide export outer membrane protein
MVRGVGHFCRCLVGRMGRLAAVGALLLAGGCGVIPTAGPGKIDIAVGQTDPQSVNYGFVKITSEVVRTLAEYEPRGIANAFHDRRPPPEIKFGIGDVISVSIFEAAAGGLFIPTEAGVRPGNFVTLPNQPVDTQGNISVPYAGAVPAKGKTPSEVQEEIVDKIKNRAIEPQAVVALVNQNTSLISVLGEVNNPQRFPALPAGEHILDSITRGGGIKDQGHDSWVVLERSGRRASIPFGDLIYEPANNIWAWPGDTIYVFRQPQTFLAFGAAGQQGQFNFDAWRVSLAEAVGKAGGLLDIQADPGSVYLYRIEPRELAQKLGVDCSKYAGPSVPVIYRISFRDPGGYFLATKLAIRDKDVVFAANADAVDVSKLLSFLTTINGTLNGGLTTELNAQSVRIDSKIH